MNKLTGLEPHPAFGNCSGCGFPLTNKGECMNAECYAYVHGCGQCCSFCKRCTGGCTAMSDDPCICGDIFND